MTTLNPSDKKNSNVVLSNGNLTVTGNDASNNWVRSTTSKASGKYYVEATHTTVANSVFGIADLSAMTYPGFDAKSFGLYSNGFGSIAGAFPDWLTPYASGNVVGMAVDLTAKLVWWRVGAGNWNGSGTANPATGTGGFNVSTYTGTPHYYVSSGGPGSVSTINFGATAFANAAPSGFGPWDAPLVTTPVKVWSGSAWVTKPLKVWTGSAWVQKPLKFWNGTAWVTSGGVSGPLFGAVVQSNSGTGAASSSFSPTLGSAVGAGNLVVLMVVANNVPSGANSGWTKSTDMSPVANSQGMLWWFGPTTGGEAIPSVTFAGASTYAWVLVEYAGPFDASPYGTSAGAATNNGIFATMSTPSITPTAGNNFLIVAGLGGQDGDHHWNTAGSITLGSFTNSFTNVVQQYRLSNPESHVASQSSRVVTSASGSYSTTATPSASAPSGGSCVVGMTIAFKRGV